MSLYVDTSALLKRYIDEPESDACEQILLADLSWITARLTWVEVKRNLARLLEGKGLDQAREQFQSDWRRTHIVELDQTTCELAASLAEVTKVRSLDAFHLAAAQRVGGNEISFLTFDIQQAQAARSLGMMVLP